ELPERRGGERRRARRRAAGGEHPGSAARGERAAGGGARRRGERGRPAIDGGPRQGAALVLLAAPRRVPQGDAPRTTSGPTRPPRSWERSHSSSETANRTGRPSTAFSR